MAATFVLLMLFTGCSSNSGGATPSENTEPSDTAFCDAIADWMAVIERLDTTTDQLGSSMSTSTGLDDPPTADELHATGQALLSGVTEGDGIIDVVLANTKDPQVAEALRGAHDVVFGMYKRIGIIARDSESVFELLIIVTEGHDLLYDFLIDQQAQLDALDGDAVERYMSATCPDLYSPFGDDSAQGYDTNAKADVSTLGKEIATYYVDNDPDPVITVEDDRYLLLGIDVGAVASGNRLTDQYYNGPTDWCVEVTNDRGGLKTFSYSAQRGLEAGTCR